MEAPMVVQGVTLNTLFRRLEKMALKITHEVVYDVRLYRILLRQVHSLHATRPSYKEIFDFVKPLGIEDRRMAIVDFRLSPSTFVIRSSFLNRQ
jgi:hypothetical protein